MAGITYQYTFNLTISVPELNSVVERRLRLSHSASELLQRTFCKVLTYCHSYHPDLEFAIATVDYNEPLLSVRDLTGNILTWIDIGCPSVKKLNRPIRSHNAPETKLYFYRSSHKAEFRSEFHGYKSDLLTKVNCFQFDPDFLKALCEVDNRNSTWNITFIDNSIYLEANGHTFESTISSVDLKLLMKEEMHDHGESTTF